MKSTFKKNFIPSFWEDKHWFQPKDVLILGGGIVGIQTANYLKSKQANLKIAVIDRAYPPIGASTRNAGFACIGSIGELLDDIETIGFEQTINLVARRYEGLKLLKSSLTNSDHFVQHSNWEVYRKEEKSLLHLALKQIEDINAALKQRLSLSEDIYHFHQQSRIASCDCIGYISNRLEGQLDPGAMMHELYTKARNLGVEIFTDEIIKLEGQVATSIAGKKYSANKIVLATNGFTNQLSTENQIRPVLNQVIVSAPISGLTWEVPIHLEQGYGYLRRIGDSVLVGGFRNRFPKGSESDQFEIHQEVGLYLREVLRKFIPENVNPRIDFEWSGVLGIGVDRNPQVFKTNKGYISAAGLGGMGVALGSLLAKEASQMVLQSA